jgi:hypothetical protein
LRDVDSLKRWANPLQPLGGGQDDGPALILAFERCSDDSIINLPGPLYTVEKVLNTTLHNTVINLDGVLQYTWVADDPIPSKAPV